MAGKLPISIEKSSKEKPQGFYNSVKQKFAEERNKRISYRPEGTGQFTSEFTGKLANYALDPYAGEAVARNPIKDTVEVLIIGGGFSALLTAARLRESGVESIRIVERGADVGGTWYWNRYPGVTCDVEAYDYLPLLDEMNYVPVNHYSRGPEIFSHCQAIAKKYDLYDLAVFQTTVNSTVWCDTEKKWHIETDRNDQIKAQFVVCANGTLSKPKLSKISGMENFAGHAFHTSRWDYNYTGENLEKLKDKTVGVIGTGASAVQVVAELAKAVKHLYVFQRTPSSIDVREDYPTDPNWARQLKPGWQAKRREAVFATSERTPDEEAERAAMSTEDRIRSHENANIDYMMRVHKRIDEVVKDKQTAEALKPWYMFMCKRPCIHNDYLPSFNLPNVTLVDTKGKGITEINETGPIFDGTNYDLDLLVYATGFEVQKTGVYNKIVGTGGLDLTDKYADGIRTLFGIHSEGYPNLFIMGGYQASFQLNLTYILQSQGDHIAECINYTRKNGYQSIEPSGDAEEWWVQEVIKNRGTTNFNSECTPGYYNFEGESNRRQDGNYNGGFQTYVDFQTEVRANMQENFVFAK
ncbi:MAG: cation diffusion facilitator CzcD-associated flavoprotein CzcO [Candidatus Azotimanducaceae bacterium]|jgi:cation diffusion facilitator CzcD-associated flavoprotein CzcO